MKSEEAKKLKSQIEKHIKIETKGSNSKDLKKNSRHEFFVIMHSIIKKKSNAQTKLKRSIVDFESMPYEKSLIQSKIEKQSNYLWMLNSVLTTLKYKPLPSSIKNPSKKIPSKDMRRCYAELVSHFKSLTEVENET